MREELLRRLDSRLKQLAASVGLLDEISMLTLDQQVELFRETFIAAKPLREMAQQYVDLRFADARQANRERRLAAHRPHRHMRLLGVENASFPVEWLYLQDGADGYSGNADAMQAVIDEVQDYG